jgi:preprotein translocase subunit SecE
VTRIRRFLEEAWSELKKVTWPTREQTRNLTILVFVVSGLVGLFITAFDAMYAQILAFLSRV